VLGAHDESAIICTHATRVHNEPVALPVDRIRKQLIARSPTIMAGIDRTQHGPAGAALSALRKLVGLAEGHEALAVPTPRGVYLGQRLRFVAGRSWVDSPELSTTEHADLDAIERRLAALYDRIHTP
jgi:L-lactate dehydrogenase